MDNHKNSGFDEIHFHEKIRLAGRYNKDWKHATLSWFAGPDRFKRGGDHKSTNWRQKHQWLVENIEREVGKHDVNQDEKTLATTLATMYAPESTDVPADTVKHPWNGCLHSFQGFIQQLVSVHVRKRRGELTAHDADTHIQVKPCFRKKETTVWGKRCVSRSTGRWCSGHRSILSMLIVIQYMTLFIRWRIDQPRRI